jgi:multimeric flavodoxin WrbA
MEEMMKTIMVLGISGSPRKQSNTRLMIEKALEGARKVERVQTEILDLSTMNIQNCIGCEACRRKKSLCVAIKDDMESIYPKLINCDALVLGSPVYFGDVTGLTKAFMDRTTCLGGTPAKELQYRLKWKVGGAIAVGGARHGGQEYTLKTIHNFFLMHGMLVVSGIPPSGYWGAAGWAMERKGILKDVVTISTTEICEDLGWRVAVTAKYFYEGKNNLGVDLLRFTKK